METVNMPFVVDNVDRGTCESAIQLFEAMLRDLLVAEGLHFEPEITHTDQGLTLEGVPSTLVDSVRRATINALAHGVEISLKEPVIAQHVQEEEISHAA